MRVVLAEDSDIAAELLEQILERDPQIRVVARAHDGAELLALPVSSVAQVVLLDLLMPQVAGLSALRQLASRKAVIVVSSEPGDSASAREALAQGAFGYFCKADLSEPRVAELLRDAVRRASRKQGAAAGDKIVLIGGSTGAVEPLTRLLRELRSVSVPSLVVQHLPTGREAALAHTLELLAVSAQVARDRALLQPGVLLAPSGHHLQLYEGERVRLWDGLPINGHLPSVEVLFSSALPFSKRVVAVMLSGLGNDGAKAMAELAAMGATCLAQEPGDCRAPSMPSAALAASRAVRAVRVDELGTRVRRAVGHGG